MKDYLHQENYIRQLQSDLGHLKKKWSQKYPRRISGGVAAVAGFHYQFLTYLLESVNAWLGLEYEKDKPQVFTECISDIISSHKQNVVLITQVKITQSSKHIRDALSELWEINKLALEETPDLVKRLQFRILSARKGLKNVRRSIENWRPSDAELGVKELKDFQTRTQADIFSHPEDELLSLLANKLKARRPRETIQRWLGCLLRAGDKNNFESEAKNIWNELHGLIVAGMDQQKPAAIYIWTYADRPPDSLAKGNVLTGSQPIIDNLRKGYFAPRDELYNSIGDRIVNWIENNPAEIDPVMRLPIFWIGGRSGCGKSVALLNVLAILHEAGHGPILYLGNKVDSFPDAISWSQYIVNEERPECPVIIAIDDPYSPSAQQDAERLWQNQGERA